MPNVPILYPLKNIREPLVFWWFLGVKKWEHWSQMVYWKIQRTNLLGFNFVTGTCFAQPKKLWREMSFSLNTCLAEKMDAVFLLQVDFLVHYSTQSIIIFLSFVWGGFAFRMRWVCLSYEVGVLKQHCSIYLCSYFPKLRNLLEMQEIYKSMTSK